MGRSGHLFKQLTLLIVLWALACASVSGQEPYSAAPNTQPPTTSFNLNGVLISENARIALINHRLSRVGDRVGGAQILAIDEGSVRIRMGSRKLTVRVGATVVGERLPNTIPEIRRESVLRSPTKDVAVASLAVPATPANHGPVKPGETLSGITQQYLRNGVTMDQMMIALFRANPGAFSGNINVLHEGAILRIPDDDELRWQRPEIATAQVGRHLAGWQPNNKGPTQLARTADKRKYGPIDSGETLSGIAVRLSRDGITMNQMMVALFQANPQAFSGNINVLHEGAILQIPEGDELRDQRPETATAEVVRQTQAWRVAFEQHAGVTTAHPHMTASSQ